VASLEPAAGIARKAAQGARRLGFLTKVNTAKFTDQLDRELSGSHNTSTVDSTPRLEGWPRLSHRAEAILPWESGVGDRYLLTPETRLIGQGTKYFRSDSYRANRAAKNGHGMYAEEFAAVIFAAA
jgi:hypothetical protein